MTSHAADLCFSSSFFVHATSILVRKRTRTLFHTRLPYILSILYHTGRQSRGLPLSLVHYLILVHLNYTILIHYFSRFPFPSSDRHRPLLKLHLQTPHTICRRITFAPSLGRPSCSRPSTIDPLPTTAGRHTHTHTPHPPLAHNPDIWE